MVREPSITPRQRSLLILAEVAAKNGHTLAELMEAVRSHKLAYVRHEGMYELRQRTKLSLSQIGNLLGVKDHATVRYGIRKHAQRIALRRAA